MIVKELVAKLGLEFEEGAFDKVEVALGVLKKGAFGVVAAVGAAAVGLLEMGRETANAANDTYKLAQRMGVTTDAAQELAYAANATGSSAESLQTAMFRMSRTIDAAKHGSAEAQKALSGLGVPLRDLYKMKPDEQFEKLAGGLASTKDQGQKATKATGIFGRGVIDLMPMINKGAEGIAHFREEAHEMGLVLSEQTIGEAREWKKEMRIAGEQVEALKFRVGSLVIHGVVKLIRAWSDFKKQNADKIIGALKSAIVLLTGATIAYGLAHAGAIGAAVAGWIKLGVVSMATGARMAAAWLASVAPIALAGAGVAMLWLWMDDLYHFAKGDKATAIGKVWAIWKEDIHSAADAAKALLGTAMEIVNIGDWQGKAEKQGNAFQADLINDGVRRRRIERGVIDEAGNPTAQAMGPLMPLLSPSLPSPSLPGASSRPSVLAPNMSTTINVNAQPGMNPTEIAGQVRRELDDWHAGKMREAAAAAE